MSSRAKNARWMNCKLVFSNLSQFFHNRLFFFTIQFGDRISVN